MSYLPTQHATSQDAHEVKLIMKTLVFELGLMAFSWSMMMVAMPF